MDNPTKKPIIDLTALKQSIPTDSPYDVMQCASEAEALGITVAQTIQHINAQLAVLATTRTARRLEVISANQGDKVLVANSKADAGTADIDEKIAVLTADLIFYKHTMAMIDRRCSMCQSFLNTISVMAKTGVGATK